MVAKDVGQNSQQIGLVPQERTEQCSYHWMYETAQDQDIEVQVTAVGQGLFTIDTLWYRTQVRTYDLLDTVVRFCQNMYGPGKLTIIMQ